MNTRNRNSSMKNSNRTSDIKTPENISNSSSRLKLYGTVIRPIVTYVSETWVLKEAIIQKLLVFERKILRRIFGPTKDNQI